MKQLHIIYLLLILVTFFYLIGIEGIASGHFHLQPGGRDHVFTFYDITLILVLFVTIALASVSYIAYAKKKSDRLFFIALAFFLFALKSGLKIIDNFLTGDYSYIGISIQTLELLILACLFYAIFKSSNSAVFKKQQ